MDLRVRSDRIAERIPVSDGAPVHIDDHMGAQASLIVENVGAQAGVIPKHEESASDTV